MSKKPQILETRILAQSRLFTIEGVDLQFANGERRCYERVRGRHAESVMIVPLLKGKHLLLIREYAVGIDNYVLAFPKGNIDAGETILASADRELMEEVGYGSRRLTQLVSSSAAPGYNTSIMHVVLAEDLYPKRLPGDEPEPLEVVEWPFDKLDDLLVHPQFCEARSQAALLFLERHIRHG